MLNKHSVATGSLIIVWLAVVAYSFVWGWKSLEAEIDLDPDVVRHKRIEQRLIEVDSKIDQLIEIGKKWQ